MKVRIRIRSEVLQIRFSIFLIPVIYRRPLIWLKRMFSMLDQEAKGNLRQSKSRAISVLGAYLSSNGVIHAGFLQLSQTRSMIVEAGGGSVLYMGL